MALAALVTGSWSCKSVDRGTAGASARREFDGRRRARQERARERWNTVGLGRIGAHLEMLETPAHEQAWANGASGEEQVAQRLEELLRGRDVVLLHDRSVPGSRANIDHIATGPGGVTVIDTKNYKGRVRTVRRGGLWRPRTQQLIIGGRDKTELVEAMKRQVALVRSLVASSHPGAEIRGALCMAKVDGLPLLRRAHVDGVVVDGAKGIAKLARRSESRGRLDVERLAEQLARALPPA